MSEDTLPQWLYQRFVRSAIAWEHLAESDRLYWSHEAAAVRRAVERNGFKRPELGDRSLSAKPKV